METTPSQPAPVLMAPSLRDSLPAMMATSQPVRMATLLSVRMDPLQTAPPSLPVLMVPPSALMGVNSHVKMEHHFLPSWLT